MKNKTVILVTHQLQYIKQAPKILLLNNGQMQGYGTYSELSKLGIDFVQIANDEKEKEKQHKMEMSGSMRKSFDSLHQGLHSSQTSLISDADGDALSNFITGEALQQKTETSTTGSVQPRVYWVYIRAGAGILLLTLLISSNIATQFLFNSSDYYLALWTDAEIGKDNLISSLERNTHIYILTGLVAALFILSLVRTTCYFTICMRSSINLHNRLFECLIRAPITFFDNNPIGVLLNRCSRDIGIVDDLLPPTAFDAIEIFVQMIGIIILVATINYWVIIPTLILAFIFYFVRKYYITSARRIKRLEGITRSPVFSHLANSLYGLSTVRAFNVQETFEKKFDEYQDCHTASWFLFIAAARWFGIVLDLLCIIYLAVVTVAMSLSYETKTPSEIGLSISYAIALSGMFQWGVRQSAEAESQMTSIERIDEFSHVEPEKNLELPEDKRPPNSWPIEGSISFNNVSLAYDPDSPPVLKNLTFDIKPGEKIGIVGRTGAGKSSMISALFRLLPPTGTIKIDNIDTGIISLTELRKKLSIIPQDPVIFAGSVRQNIDPFNQHSDKRLWQVLEEVQLKNLVKDADGGLNSAIAEGGTNLSIGQRQLFCLARAILKENNILVLDEATANVDHK